MARDKFKSLKTASIVLVLLTISTPIFGAETLDDLKKDLAVCAANVGTLDRLECFDNLTAMLDLNAAHNLSPEVDDVGKWIVTNSINPVDDSQTVVLSLTAESGVSRWGDRVRFYARCQSNKTEAFIDWGGYLGDDSNDVYSEWKYVTIRLGDQRAKKQRWGVSTDAEATFAPAWAGNLLQELSKVDRLVVQTTPYSESPVTAIFDTKGFKNALPLLAETCGWEIGE